MNQTLLSEICCFSSSDCPTIGFDCYFPTSWYSPVIGIVPAQERAGICKCSIILAVYGQTCQHSSILERIIGSLFVCLFVGQLSFSVYSMIQMRSKMRDFNALTTIFVQVTLALVFVVFGLFFLLYRSFFPARTEFWVIGGCYFCFVMTVILGLSGTFNISLLWIEISSNSRLKILTNVQRTKPILVILFISLNTFCVILVLLSKIPSGVAFAVLVFSVVCTIVAFGVGSRRVMKFLQTYDADPRRNLAKMNEAKRIAETAKSFCFFGALVLVIGVLFVTTSDLNFVLLGYILFKATILSAFFIGLTVIYHMRGQCFVCLKILKCDKDRIFRRFQAEQIHPPSTNTNHNVLAEPQIHNNANLRSFKIRVQSAIQVQNS